MANTARYILRSLEQLFTKRERDRNEEDQVFCKVQISSITQPKW